MSPVDPGEKFAIIAIQNASCTGSIDLELGDGISVHSASPVLAQDPWKEWIGTLNFEVLTEANLVLMASATSSSTETMNGEDKQLEQVVLGLFYALLLMGVPSMDGSLYLSGANTAGEIRVKQLSLQSIFYVAHRTLPHRISPADVVAASVAAARQRLIYASAEFGRLKRGFHSLIRGLGEPKAAERLHYFIRSLEALVKPAVGRSKSQFSSRSQAFTGHSEAARVLLGQLYDLRSCAEHLHDWDCGLSHLDEEDRERTGSRRAYQAELLACSVFARTFASQELQEHFRSDSAIDTFWTLSPEKRTALFGNTVDLEALADQSFRFGQ